tara:strand:- start:107 stop:763 length:657 start_codon:yes stop_codon:yes gene_type:complete
MKNRIIISILIFLFLTTITSKQTLEISKFKLKKIDIENNFLLNEEDIKKQLIPIYDKNLIFLRNSEVEKELVRNSFIDSFNIKKKYPDTLRIKIFEKKPIAILLKEKKRFYLSEKIELIEFNNYKKLQNLPLVLGDEVEFKIFYNNLKKINFPFELADKFTLYEMKRWDIETVNKNIIKLPPKNYLESLKNYLKLRNQIESKKYKVFDYRIKNQLIVK